MKFRPLWTKKYYYKRILIIMMAFSFLLFLPFAFISYEISQKNILNSISTSNNFVLSQLNHSYGYYSQTNSNICMEVFLNNSVQQLLYSNDIAYNEVYAYLKNVSDTTMQTNSSIESIVIYNRKRNEWFSTEPKDGYSDKELADFISTQQSIPKLQPILRKITKKQGGLEISQYVFSYFMYQFSDPVSNMDSYIVVNENAGWFIENIASIKQTESFTNSIYLIDESGIIFSYHSTIDSEIGQSLVDDFWGNHVDISNQGSQYNLLKHDGNKYLVSSIKLGSQKNFLLIVQDYNEVFKDLLNLQRDYILFGLLLFIAIIIMLQLFSKRIYSPLQVFMNHISKSDSTNNLSVSSENEFDYLRNIYQNANELNEKLLLQSEVYEPIIEQFQLIRLATNTSENIKDFEKAFPGHWLITKEKKRICVSLIKIDNFQNNKYHFEDTDINLLTYAVRNIILELFTQEYEFVSIFQDSDSLCIITDLSGGGTDRDTLLALVEKCQLYINQYLDVTISVSYSGIDDDILNLDKIVQEAKEYMQYRYVFGAGSIMNRKRCLINLGNGQVNYPYEFDEKLITSIRGGNVSSASVALEDIKNTLYSFQYVNITMCIMALVNKIVLVLNQMKHDDQISAHLKISYLYQMAVNAEFIETFFSELGEYISSVLSDGAGMDAERRDVLDISAVIEFVQNHFSDTNLSSQMISDYLGLSNRYVMYKFKECTGTSLSEYIVTVRMRKAANLLQNTDLPVNKIVTQIGIESDTYFYRLFKKVYHCTPREFSEQYRKT